MYKEKHLMLEVITLALEVAKIKEQCGFEFILKEPVQELARLTVLKEELSQKIERLGIIYSQRKRCLPTTQPTLKGELDFIGQQSVDFGYVWTFLNQETTYVEGLVSKQKEE